MVSLLASLELFVARSFLKQRRVPNENFRISDAEKVRQKNLISPSLIHAIFSLPECLWNTEVFPMHFVGKRRQKFFDGICFIPRLVHIFLPILEIFWKHEDFSMIFSGTVIQKLSTEKVIFLSLIHEKFFAARSNWNIEEFPEKVCGKVRQKKRRENVITLVASIKRFLCHKFPETTKSFHWNFR